MLKSLDNAQILWDKPAELIAQWASDPNKSAEEATILRILQELQLDEGLSFVDIGCGVGRYAKALKPLNYAHYTGFDASPAMVQAAIDANTESNVEFSCIDAFNFSSDEHYDVLICIDVLIHQNDPLQAAIKLMELWDADMYLITLLAGDSHEQLYSSTVISVDQLERFTAAPEFVLEYAQVVPGESFTWVVVRYARD